MKNAFVYARAVLLALAVLMVGSVFVAGPASAHQGNITAVAQCLPNGTYQVSYTLSWDQVPEAAYGTRILTREDTDRTFDSGWEGNPGSYQWTDRGEITSFAGSISWTDTLPGTTLDAGPWEYAWLDWANGNTGQRFHDTRIEDLGGDCADTTTPTPVSVDVSFGDNVCVGNVYTEPTMEAPEFEGTTRQITGTVAPGETVTVTYTALDGYVIEGPSSFEHIFPAEPSSVTDCAEAEEPEQPEQPEPVVRDRSAERTDCEGIERREWQVVREYVWNGTEWELGAPEVAGDTGWVKVRDLTLAEQEALGCLEVAGEQDEDNPPSDHDEEQQTPSVETAPTQATSPQVVPTAVDAGVDASSVGSPIAPAGPRWLLPMLGGVIVLALAGFTRLKQLGEQH